MRIIFACANAERFYSNLNVIKNTKQLLISVFHAGWRAREEAKDQTAADELTLVAGKVTLNVDPFPTVDSTSMVP